MGIPCLILGESGSGKSTSLRNFDPSEVSVFNVASKPLPFRGGNKFPRMNGANYTQIEDALKKATKKVYVIDDSQYLSVFANFGRAKETGYNKFVDMALDEYNLVQTVIKDTAPDVIVYFLRHIDTNEQGKIKAKTIGKMLDNNLGGLEGLFAIVLLAETDGKDHWFTTQSDGYTTCKSPMEMFDDLKIPNDLKLVDTTIREFYELPPSMASAKPKAKAKKEEKSFVEEEQEHEKKQEVKTNVG